MVENEKLRISSKAHRVVVAMELKRIHRYIIFFNVVQGKSTLTHCSN